MPSEFAHVNWHDWMQRWDRQQSVYLPDREARFSAMLDVLEVLLPEQFMALDLACGPGSISQRILSRFPHARCLALDFDPVLLLLGQQVLGDMQGRLHWIEADLRDVKWRTLLGETQVDAVLSTTALHWLPAPTLVQLYQQLGALVRPGGVFLNGDHCAFGQHLPTFRRLTEVLSQEKQADEETRAGTENWRAWWDALRQEASLEPVFAERERRMPGQNHHGTDTLAELHEAALCDAGFREVDVIWQHMDNRVIMAVR
jgi:trans-aconitate methyltransferase